MHPGLQGENETLGRRVDGASANAAMIEGFRFAVENVKVPISILLITPCSLGFAGGFHGKGPNSANIQAALELVKEKGCTLTTSVVTGDVIQKFVASQSGKPAIPRENKYKAAIYRECLEKVCIILRDNGVDLRIIDQIQSIRSDS